MITREADYAIRTIRFFYQNKNIVKLISTKTLSEETEVPYRFLRKIVKKLVDAKILISQKGKGGGLALFPRKTDLSLLDILEIIDPLNIKLNICTSTKKICSRSTTCPVCKELTILQEKFHSELSKVTFDCLI